MMASGACSRDLVYFTFGDAELAEDLLDIHSFITERKMKVGDVWKLMRRYGKEMRAASSVTIKLYPFIHELQDKYECDTDDESAREREECDTTLRYTPEPESESYKENTP
ncbi:PREDICTED: poly(ADP-ribose) glycohydrolase-like [Acropora digitifera]|nr:PREDICTED: poly(ADP-ribose) glycohydrolase-like [Acropora digitifera]